MSLRDIQPTIDRYLPALEAEMRTVINRTAQDEVADLYGYLSYHLGWVDGDLCPTNGRTGKRLRPVFCLLSHEACGREDWERALPAAAAVELLHNFSLIHDDIEDNDTTRRGRPTLWSLWGIPQAINAGDALYALSTRALLRLADRDVPPATIVASLRLFTEICIRLTEGQFLDMRFESMESVPVETYLQMIRGKTAALLSASCELGSLVAAAPPDQQRRLREFGHHLGLAFQIQDDILGIWGEPQRTGKPVGSDLLRRKKTLPILHGLTHSEGLYELLCQEELLPADVPQAVRMLEQAGSREWTQEQARQQTDQALTALERANLEGIAADELRNLALALLSRTH